jgi:hypothetical protein
VIKINLKKEKQMKSSTKLTILIISLAILLSWQPLLGAKKCCIAGNYIGKHVDTASPTCPKPETGEFKLVIKQDAACSQAIKGKIVNPDGTIMPFKGEVTPGPGKCCTIKAKGENASGDWVRFKGIICKKGGTLVVKKGKYVSSSGCEGTFQMKRI